MSATTDPTKPPALPGTPVPGARLFPSVEGRACKCISQPDVDRQPCAECGLLFMRCLECRPDLCAFCQSRRIAD